MWKRNLTLIQQVLFIEMVFSFKKEKYSQIFKKMWCWISRMEATTVNCWLDFIISEEIIKNGS